MLKLGENSIINKVLVYLGGNIGVLVINFFLVPLYTFYLDKSRLGYYDIIVSTANVLLPLVSLHIELAILRWLLNSEKKHSENEIFTIALKILVISLSVFTVLYLFVNVFITIRFSITVLVYGINFFVYPFLRQFIRGLGKTKQFVFSGISYSLLMLILVFIFVVKYKMMLQGIILSNGLALFGVNLYLIINNKLWKYYNHNLKNKELYKDFLKYSIPLIPNTLGVYGANLTIKYILIHFNGVEANGIYAVAYKFASVIQIFGSVFYLAWQEKAFEEYNKNLADKLFSTTFKHYFVVLSVAIALGISIQSWIIPHVVDEKYWDVTLYLPILLLSFLFSNMASFYGVIYQCEKKTKGLQNSSLIFNLLCLLLGVFFIKYYSLVGACLTFCLGSLALMLYRAIDSRKFMRLSYNSEIIIFPLLLTFVFFMFYNMMYWISILSTIFISVLYYKNTILRTIKSMNNK